MNKFSVGDKVKVVQYAGRDSENHRYFKIGNVGIVRQVNLRGVGGYQDMLFVDFNDPSNTYIFGNGCWYVYNENSLRLDTIEIDISTLDEDALIPQELYEK